MDYSARKAEIAAMESALRVTRAHHARVLDQMAKAAQAQARARWPEWQRARGRGQSRWSGADERRFNDHLVDQYFARGHELEALERKAQRQAAAIAERRRSWGINEPASDQAWAA